MNNLPLILLPNGAPRAVDELDKLRKDNGDFDFDVRDREESNDKGPPSVLKENQLEKDGMFVEKPITIFVGLNDDYRQTELLLDKVIIRLNSGEYQTVLITDEFKDDKVSYKNTGFFIKSKYTRYAKYGFEILAFFESKVDELEPLEGPFDDVSCQGGFNVVYGVETRIV